MSFWSVCFKEHCELPLFLLAATFVDCWKPLQTVWTQIRTDRMSVLIWIQTVWHSDSVPVNFLWKSLFWKSIFLKALFCNCHWLCTHTHTKHHRDCSPHKALSVRRVHKFWLFMHMLLHSLKMHVQLLSYGFRGLNLGKILYLLPCFMCVSREGRLAGLSLCCSICHKNKVAWIWFWLIYIHLYILYMCMILDSCQGSYLFWAFWKVVNT